MGGKGGGGGDMSVYQQQADPVGHADPIDLSQNLAYINAQKAAADATAPTSTDTTPTDTGGGATTDTGSNLAKAVVSPPQYWFNQPVSTLEAAPKKKSGSMVTTNTGSV